MKLYVDVTNTLLAASMAGVQRVASELLSRLVEAGPEDIEVVFLQERGAFSMGPEITWAELDPKQAIAAMRRPATRRASAPLVPRRFVGVGELEPGAVFFDVDAVWHNQVRRSLLCPTLRSLGIATLAMHYDAVPVRHPELARPATVERFVPHLVAQLRHAVRLLAISQTVRDDLVSVARDRGWPQCDVHVVRLGSDFTPSVGDGDPEADEGDLGTVLQRGGYLLCVGTLEPRENQALVLDAFDALRGEIAGLTLVLAGQSGWLVDDLVRRIQEHPLFGDRLFWLQGMSDSILKQLYRGATAMVCPSLYEGSGLPAVEALAAGTITLCSDRGALPEATSGFAELFDPTSSDQLVARLRRHFADDAGRRRRKEGLAVFEPPLWESTVVTVVDAVRDLGGARRDRRRRLGYQIVYLSIHPELLLRTLAYVEHLMPFVDEALVVTSARLTARFRYGGSLPVRLLTDEEILGDDEELFRESDHQRKNWLLRSHLVGCDQVRDEFIMSDDDYRPLRPIPSTFFKRRSRTQAYFFHDLGSWPGRPTSYDLGLRNALGLLEARGYRSAKAFSSHCPQLIDKRLYAEMVERFGVEARRLAVDEWSIYFNHALEHHPDRFEARPYRTLCWPARPSDWEGRYPPSELYFENFYPELYRPQQIFAGLPQEYSDDYHVHSLEKATRRLLEQANYDRNRQLRDASLARAAMADLDARHQLDAAGVTVELTRLPRRLRCLAGACTKLVIEVEPVSPAPGRRVQLHHQILDAGGVFVSRANYPVDLSNVVATEAAQIVECPIFAPGGPGRYSLELRLHVDGLEPDSAGRLTLGLDVL